MQRLEYALTNEDFIAFNMHSLCLAADVLNVGLTADTANDARRCDRVSSQESELTQLWEESGDSSEWLDWSQRLRDALDGEWPGPAESQRQKPWWRLGR